MTVRYHARGGTEVPDYQCMRECIDNAGPRCQTIPGAAVDAAIGQLLLDTLTPLALEVALTVQAEIEARAAEADAHAPPATSNAPATAPTWPAAATWPSTPTTGSSPTAWKPTGTTRCAPCKPPRTTTTTPAAARRRAHRATTRPASGRWPPTSPPCGPNPATPQRERKRMVRLLIEDVTLAKTDQHPPARPVPRRPDHQPDHPDPAATPGSSARPTPTPSPLLDRLLDDHTDAETAAALNAAGHRSGEGKPFTGRIVLDLRRATTCPATPTGSAPAACSPSTEIADRLGVHISTIKAWRRAGLLTAHKANDKNMPAVRPARPRRPPAGQTPGQQARQPSSHRNNTRRCSMKPTPCRKSPDGPDRRRDARGRQLGAVADGQVLAAGVAVVDQPGHLDALAGPAGDRHRLRVKAVRAVAGGIPTRRSAGRTRRSRTRYTRYPPRWIRR